MTVLVVDDVAVNRKVLSLLLGHLGHEVVEAANTREALSVFEKLRPGAVITDLRMPEGDDGLILARALRASPGGRDLRLALMTGDYEISQLEDGLFDAVLEKPVSVVSIKVFLEGTGK